MSRFLVGRLARAILVIYWPHAGRRPLPQGHPAKRGSAITQQRSVADDDKEGLAPSKQPDVSIEQLRQLSATNTLRVQQ